MTLTFSTNKSPKNKLEKELVLIQRCDGCRLKAPTDIINPVFTVSTIAAADLYKSNYVYAPELNDRKYFITDIVAVRTDLWEVHCHIDVLSTYADGVKQQEAIIHRQENKWNLYLDDGFFKTYQNPYIVVKKFPSGFTTQNFVLAVAGD